jgi:LysR family transcriptional activator of nhaA
VSILALHGLGFIAVPAMVAKDVVARFNLRPFGRTNECQQQFYAISAESKLTHPAVVAITSNAQARLVR